MDSGFHADWLANEKALLPYVDVFECGISSCPLAVERSDCSLDYRNSSVKIHRFWCYVMQSLVDVDTELELDVFWNVELITIHFQLVKLWSWPKNKDVFDIQSLKIYLLSFMCGVGEGPQYNPNLLSKIQVAYCIRKSNVLKCY